MKSALAKMSSLADILAERLIWSGFDINSSSGSSLEFSDESSRMDFSDKSCPVLADS